MKQKHANDPAASAALLLADFGIGAPNDKRILVRNPDPDDVRAWMLYTLSPTQPGLNEPSVARPYVVKRLLNGDEPPERFRRWARLSPAEWNVLWRADYYGGPYVEALSPALDDFGAWCEDFAGVFPDGPFANSKFDWQALQTFLATHLGCDDFTLHERNAMLEILLVAEAGSKVLGEERYDEIVELLRAQGVLHHVDIASPGKTETRGLGTPDPSTHTTIQDGWTAKRVWEAALDELRLQMTQATFDAWLRQSWPVCYENGVLVVGVHSAYAKDWLENRLLHIVKRTLVRLTGREMSVEFVAKGEAE